VYREDTGDYRIIYRVQDRTLIVLEFGNRKDIYRNLKSKHM